MSDSNKIVNDIVEVSAKTALSVIPVGGALIANVWDAIKDNCAKKRLNEWQNLVEMKLSKLDSSLEDIGSNENFTSAMFIATELALKTAEKEKREYLANAVINSIDMPIDESVEMIFFDLIGKYTCWHLRILNYFENPKKYEVAQNANSYMMGSPKTILYQLYPELEKNDKLVDKLVKEMFMDGMLNTQDMNCSMTSQGMIASRVTDLGRQFIEFISASLK